MSEPVTIYHNPRCSKSREALALLTARGIAPRVVEYLETPPGVAELRAILDKLGMKPEALVRKGEAVFKEGFEGRALSAAPGRPKRRSSSLGEVVAQRPEGSPVSDEAWLEAMTANPILIERPIVVRGARAVVGRPPERVLELL